jgi:MFS family permease
MIAVLFASSTLVTPLYGLYRQSLGFSELTLTLIYAVYVVGNLLALLFLGRLSDQIGRRSTALPALALAALSTLLFIAAHDTALLFGARMLSGLAIGLGSGTGMAWLAELQNGADKSKATLIATCANFIGLGLGPLLGGVLAQYAPRPLLLPYLVYLAMLGLTVLLIAYTPETVTHPVRDRRELSLRPRLGVPAALRLRFLAPAATAFGTFALFGFYFALAPTMLAEELGQHNRAAGGAVVCELALIASATIFATRHLSSRAAMLSGLALLLPSLALLVSAQSLRSMLLLLLGTALSGSAGALGYRGSLQTVNQMAPAQQRAEVVSSYLVTCFLGNSVPVIGIGVLTQTSGAVNASFAFAASVGMFVLVALATGARYTR